MQRNFKLILSIVIVLLSGALVFGQEEQEKVAYKDVTLDGKPAKLNVATGEITFVNPDDKRKPIKFDDFVAKSNKTAKTNSNIETDYYIVEEGETLLEIANRYGTTLTELKRVNNLESTLVNKGQRLRVKNLSAITVEPKSQPTYTENYSDVHIVERGQTLYSLAKKYGLSVNELKQQNGLTSNLIKIGQELRVGNFNTDTEIGHLTIWTVSKGDTLYSISRENGLTVEQLKSLNGLTNDLIKIGQKLQLK